MTHKTYSVKHLVDHIQWLKDNEFDAVMAVTGFTGMGKSVLGITVGKKADGKEFSFERNLVYKRSELSEKIKRSAPEGSYVHVDEAINVLFKRDFAQGDQRELIKLMNMCRDRHLILFFFLPDFFSLDKEIINTGRIRYWIHIYQRGRAYIFQPNANPFAGDKWDTKLNEKLWGKKIYKSRNFVGELIWHDLSDEEYAEYEAVKRKKKEDAERDEVKQDKRITVNKAKSMFIDMMARLSIHLQDSKYIRHGFDTQVCKFFGWNVETLRRRKVHIRNDESTKGVTMPDMNYINK